MLFLAGRSEQRTIGYKANVTIGTCRLGELCYTVRASDILLLYNDLCDKAQSSRCVSSTIELTRFGIRPRHMSSISSQILHKYYVPAPSSIVLFHDLGANVSRSTNACSMPYRVPINPKRPLNQASCFVPDNAFELTAVDSGQMIWVAPTRSVTRHYISSRFQSGWADGTYHLVLPSKSVLVPRPSSQGDKERYCICRRSCFVPDIGQSSIGGHSEMFRAPANASTPASIR